MGLSLMGDMTVELDFSRRVKSNLAFSSGCNGFIFSFGAAEFNKLELDLGCIFQASCAFNREGCLR